MFQLAGQSTGGIADSPVTFPILAIALALSVYILWRRYRSRRRLVERVAELEILSEAGHSIVAAELNVASLCKLFGQQVDSIIDAGSTQIALFENGMAKIQYWTLDSRYQEPPAPHPIDRSDDYALQIWQGRDSTLVYDTASVNAPRLGVSESDGLFPIGLGESNKDEIAYRSAVLVPLISGPKVIGFLAALDVRPNSFNERDLGQLTILSNQAASAISNAISFQQERDRSAHLELVGRIARQITAINDLDELLRQVVTLTQDTFGFSSVNIFGIDPISKEAFNQASSLKELGPNTLRLAPGEGLIGTVINEQKTILSNDTRNDDRFLGIEISVDTRSEIVIPLVIDQDLLGVFDIQSDQIGAFSEQDQRVLEALADQIAVAINKARQFAAQRERAWIATAQLQVAEAVGQSDDVESLAESIVRLVTILVGAKASVLLLWDDQSELYKVSARYGFREHHLKEPETASISLGEWSALDAVHVAKEMLVTDRQMIGVGQLSDESETDLEDDLETYLLPLMVKEKIIGVLTATFQKTKAVIKPRVRREILRNFAAQTAQGIDALKLQFALQEEAWVNTALLQVAEAVNRLTDLDEILFTIVRLVPMLVGVKNSVVLIWDEERSRYKAGPSHGISEMAYGTLESFEIDLKEFPLLDKQELERAGPDSAYYTFQLPDWMSTVIGSARAGVFPLRARGRLVGVLVVGPTKRGRPLSGRRLNIVIGIAQQAAIAVVNDQLYLESTERNRMEQELNMAHTIQSSLLPEENPEIPGCSIAGYWQAARQVSGDFYDFMQFADGRWGIAIADVADKGIPAALFMALSRTILRTVAFNRRSPSEVLHRSNQIIYGDTTSDHFVTVFYAVWDPKELILHYANGGHNPPLLLKKDGASRLLSSEGIALGVIEDVSYAEKSVKLEKGDSIVFYTDGITEAVNEDYDEFGLDRLLQTVRLARSESPKSMINRITGAVSDHAGNTPQFDDITLVVLKR